MSFVTSLAQDPAQTIVSARSTEFSLPYPSPLHFPSATTLVACSVSSAPLSYEISGGAISASATDRFQRRNESSQMCHLL